MSLKAVIDLGTNTFHLLIAEVEEAKRKIIFRKQIPVKLGEGGINSGYISDAAYTRGLDAMKQIKTLLDEYHVDSLSAFATSAIRSAKNGVDFTKEVKELTGIDINIIDGITEARYIFQAIYKSMPLTDEQVLVMDIGGGSVEFIIGNKDGIAWEHSYDIGAARLVEKFHKHDPIAPEDVEALNKYLSEVLAPLEEVCKQYKVKTLIGSAGSFESIADLINEQFDEYFLEEDETWCELPIEKYKMINQLLVLSTTEQRKQLKGLTSFRVEMMVVASLMVNFVIDELQIDTLMCSSYSLKEGVLFSQN